MINLYKLFNENNKTKNGRIFTLVVHLTQIGFTIAAIAALIIHVVRG